jgi:RimJ/RimL family protein N-acetyltransferase
MTSRLDEIDWPLHTERLTIRRVTADDVDALWQIRRQEEVGRWMTSAATDRKEFRVRFLHADRMANTLVVELDGAVVGDLMLAVQDAWSQAEVASQAKGVQAELAWCLDPAHTGRGYATEALEALIELCFGRLGLRRVTANCFADNTASWRLMERVGMRREISTLRESLHRSGDWLDGLGYALLADEWRR